MSASLRKMLQMKAIAEGKARPNARGGPVAQDQQLVRGPKEAALDAGARPGEQPEPGPPSGEVPAGDDGPEQRVTKRRRQDPRLSAPEEPAKPTLKARKKEFLKRKKLRKKGKAVGNGDDSGEEDSDPEARLAAATAATRPKFGETSAQPIKANLKRRHWTAEDKRATDTRLTTLFKKQLETAAGKAASEATRLEAIEAYRKKKQGATAPTATLRSLAALVEKEHVASM